MTTTKVAGSLTVPLSFRVSAAHLEEIERATKKEVRKYRTEVIEMIWEWAWKEYKRSGSLRALLQGTRTRKYSRRVSEELQDQLYTFGRRLVRDVVWSRAAVYKSRSS